MSNYNTAAALEALQPPSFEHEGVVHVGVFVSIREWMFWMGKVDDYANNKLDLDAVLALHADLCGLWFPPPRRERWYQRWFAPGVSPVWLLLEPLPLAIQVDAIKSFLVSQAATFGMAIPKVPPFGSEDQPKTNGTKVSHPTPSLKKETSLSG